MNSNRDSVKFSRDGEYMIVYYKEQFIQFKKGPIHLKDNKYFIDVKKQPNLRENYKLDDQEIENMQKSIDEFVKKAGVWVTFID